MLYLPDSVIPHRFQTAFILIGYQQPATLLCLILLHLSFVFRVSIIVWVDQPKPIGNLVCSAAWLTRLNTRFHQQSKLASALTERNAEASYDLDSFPG